MSTTFLVASLELRQRTRLFAVAAAVALIPFITAALPAARNARSSAIGVTGLVLAIAFSTAIALGLGVSTVGRELTEKRLSFYFARPISAASMWFGKVIASMLVVYAVALIIGLPAYLASRPHAWFGSRLVVALAVAMPLVLFLASHTISTIVRSRSIVMAIDLVCAVVTNFAVFLLLRPVVLGGALDVAKWMLLAIGIALVVILAIAPIGQLAHGRTDIRRSHAALARFLWPAVGGVLLIVALFVWWLTTPALSSLDEMQNVAQSANGDWALVEGSDANRFGYQASYLVNTVTGESERMPLPSWWGATISADGRVLTWLEPVDLMPGPRVFVMYVRRLEQGAKAVETKIQLPAGASYVVSADGSRLAVNQRGQLSIVDVASGQILAAANAFQPHLMFFVDRDRVRVIESGNLRVGSRLGELDAVTRKFTITGQFGAPAQIGAASANADGSLLYIPPRDAIVDGRTGAMRATLSLHAGARMIADGTLVDVADNTLRRFDAQGREIARIAMPFPRAAVLGQLGATKVLVGGTDGAAIVDLGRNVVVAQLPGAHPAWTWSHDPRVRRYADDAIVNCVQKRGSRVQLVKMKTAS